MEPILCLLIVGKGGSQRGALWGTPQLVIAVAPRIEQAVQGLNEGPIAAAIRIGPIDLHADSSPSPPTNRLAYSIFHEGRRVEREVQVDAVVHSNAEGIMYGPVEPRPQTLQQVHARSPTATWPRIAGVWLARLGAEGCCGEPISPISP